MGFMYSKFCDTDWHVYPIEGGEGIPCADEEKAQALCNYLNGGDGLTRRERFAMAAMQGIQASNFNDRTRGIANETNVAIWAVAQADALLEELERTA